MQNAKISIFRLMQECRKQKVVQIHQCSNAEKKKDFFIKNVSAT